VLTARAHCCTSSVQRSTAVVLCMLVNSTAYVCVLLCSVLLYCQCSSVCVCVFALSQSVAAVSRILAAVVSHSCCCSSRSLQSPLHQFTKPSCCSSCFITHAEVLITHRTRTAILSSFSHTHAPPSPAQHAMHTHTVLSV
jgi:hypothetical protein